jgi:hypothetical protein
VFVKLEKPALELLQYQLRENITRARITFIEDIIIAQELKNLDAAYLSEQLEYYEKAAQDAVEGSLRLANPNSNDTSIEAFPSKGEKWTIMQGIYLLE